MSRPRTKSPVKHIVRMEYDYHTHGWKVRPPQRNGKRLGPIRFFGDEVHGGKEQALKTAKDYLDQYTVEDAYKKQHLENRPLTTGLPEIGVPGVFFYLNHSWLQIIGSYYDGAYNLRQISRNVNKHGVGGALTDAVKFRHEGLGEQSPYKHWTEAFEAALNGRTLAEIEREIKPWL